MAGVRVPSRSGTRPPPDRALWYGERQKLRAPSMLLWCGESRGRHRTQRGRRESQANHLARAGMHCQSADARNRGQGARQLAPHPRSCLGVVGDHGQPATKQAPHRLTATLQRPPPVLRSLSLAVTRSLAASRVCAHAPVSPRVPTQSNRGAARHIPHEPRLPTSGNAGLKQASSQFTRLGRGCPCSSVAPRADGERGGGAGGGTHATGPPKESAQGLVEARRGRHKARMHQLGIAKEDTRVACREVQAYPRKQARMPRMRKATDRRAA